MQSAGCNCIFRTVRRDAYMNLTNGLSLDSRSRVIEGARNMPPLPVRHGFKSAQLLIYDGVKDGENVRVAAFALSLLGTSAKGVALIQVGETLSRRTAMADRATLAIVFPMLLMTLTAAAAIAYGVGRGLCRWAGCATA